MAVVRGEMADDARAAGGGVHNGDHVAKLGFEGRVEVGAALDADETVGVCELGEDVSEGWNGVFLAFWRDGEGWQLKEGRRRGGQTKAQARARAWGHGHGHEQ